MGEPGQKMKCSVVVSLSSTRFSALALKKELEESFGLLRRLGFEGAELAIRNPEEIDKKQVLSLLERYQLLVPALGTGQAYVDEGLSLTSPEKESRQKARERIFSHLELSAVLKAKVIIGLIRGSPEPSQKESSLEILKDELGIICEKAKSLGSPGLVLEPLNRYETTIINTISQAKNFIQELASDNLKILADSFHMNIEEQDIKEALKTAGDLLGHIHLADSNRRAPGQGHFDFDNFFKALAELGYQGWLSGEFLPEPTAEESVRMFAEFLGERGLLNVGR